jgi:hypothetical protein
MLTGIELMKWIEHFGRCQVQEFVAKRQDTRDILTYLRAQRSLEMVKAMPFVTADSVSFERRGSELCAEDGLILNLV